MEEVGLSGACFVQEPRYSLMNVVSDMQDHPGPAVSRSTNGISLADEDRKRIANGVLVLSVLTGGVMAGGYAIIDEIVIYLFLFWWLWRQWIRGGRLASVDDEPVLVRLHRALFVAFALYCAVQSVRGMVYLGDLRVIRFVVFFIMLAALALIWPGGPEGIRVRGVVLAGLVYFAVYLAMGLVYEIAGGGNRFDLQGRWWVGTSVAMVPAAILVPAIASLPRDGADRWLYWSTLSVLMLASFYYQSRFGWAAVLCLLVLGGPVLGMGRVVIGLIFFVALVVWFPWTAVGPLTWQAVEAEMARNPLERVVRFAGAMTGWPQALLELEARLALDGGRGANRQTVAKLQERSKSVVISEGYSSIGAKREDKEKRSFIGVSVTADKDRVVAVEAAWCTDGEGGVGRMLFGTGYWTHRYQMIQCIEKISSREGYRFRGVYRRIVRTAMFNGMLVDTGLVGTGLLLGLFIATGLYIIRRRNAIRLVSLGALALLWLSLFVGMPYDLVTLYVALMPGSIMLPMMNTGINREAAALPPA